MTICSNPTEKAKPADPPEKECIRHRSQPVRAELIRRHRIAHAWTQRDVAKTSGLSVRLVRKAERGEPIERRSIEALAKALAVPLEALTNVAEDLPPPEGRSMGECAQRFLLSIWNEQDFSVIDELLLPEFRFHHDAGTVTNRSEMVERIVAFQSSFSDFDFVVEDTHDHGTFVVCRWHVAMTHSGKWVNLEATGKRVDVYGSTWVQVVHGLFGDAWDFWDTAKLYHELASDTA
jgi:transcriptional regulator with XRE-family HTH domain